MSNKQNEQVNKCATILRGLSVIFILSLISLIGIFAFWLLIDDPTTEKLLFFSFLILLFTIIFCVSVMGYQIGGKTITIEQARKVQNEIEDARKDIYEKLNTLEKVIKKSAQTQATQVAYSGMWGGMPPKLRLEIRGYIYETLEALEIDKSEIDTIVTKIDECVLSILFGKLARTIKEYHNEKNIPYDQEQTEEQLKYLYKIEPSTKRLRQKIEEKLKELNLLGDTVKEKLDEYLYFIENKKLLNEEVD